MDDMQCKPVGQSEHPTVHKFDDMLRIILDVWRKTFQ